MQVTISEVNAISMYISCILLISLWIAYRRNRKLTLSSQHAMSSGLLGFSAYTGKRQPSASQRAREMQEGIVRRVAVADPYLMTLSRVPSFGHPQVEPEPVNDAPTAVSGSIEEREVLPEPPSAPSIPQVASLMIRDAVETLETAAVAAENTTAVAVEECSVICADCEISEETESLKMEFEHSVESIETPLNETFKLFDMQFGEIAPSGQAVEPSLVEFSNSADAAPSFAAGETAVANFEFSFPEPVEIAESVAAPVARENSESAAAPVIAESFEEPIVQSFPGPESQAEPAAPAFLGFYGLNEQPFGVTPDPAYIYPSRMHSEAISSLSQGIHSLRGFMALVAEPGMGKTTLLNKLMEELRNSARVVFLFQTQCDPKELLGYLLGELGVESAGMDLPAMHRTLNEILFREMMQGRRFVLIVDEAQNLNESTLETIRLLSDFETSDAKLIQIVLAGQPQLVETLRSPGLSQLRQRIAVLSKLDSLSAEETANYVQHRLRAAGAGGESIFTEEALALITECSQGTPRKINNLCFDSLVLGCSEGRTTIDTDIVMKVDAKLSLDIFSRRSELAAADSPAPDPILMGDSSQLARLLLSALANHNRPESASAGETPATAAIALTGKITEIIKTFSGNRNGEFRVQVSLRREASSEIPVAERYYSCSFYVEEKEAKAFQVGQSVSFKIEQN